MNRNWLEEIHDRMESYEKKAPEGTLDDIRQEMQRRGLNPGRPNKGAVVVPIWRRRAIAAAVSLLVLGGAAVWWTSSEQPETIPQAVEQPLAGVSKGSDNSVSDRESAENDWYNGGSRVNNPGLDVQSEEHSSFKANPVLAWIDDKVEEVKEDLSSALGNKDNSLLAENDNSPKPKSKERPSSARKSRRNFGEPLLAQASPSGKGRIRLGAYFSGGMYSNTSSPNFSLNSLNANYSGSNSVFGDVLLSEPNRLSQSDYSKTLRAKHHQPIKAGVSVSFPLSRKWSVTTGLNYAYLSSDFDGQDGWGKVHVDQKLHYLGIPVSVNYSVWNNRHLNVYVSGGAEVEKLVKGKAEMSESGNSDNQESSSMNVKEHRLQYSAQASAGVEYKAGKLFSIYAEPGIDYHFDNGSDVSNIYKDKPFNFSLSVGVRLNINK